MSRTRSTSYYVADSPLRVVPDNPDSPKVPKKPCSCCGRPFQPTQRRRMLCATCYLSGDGRAGNVR